MTAQTSSEPPKPWATQANDLLVRLGSSEKGLSSAEAKKRLEAEGVNEISDKQKKGAVNIFISQFANPLILVLAAAAIISYFLHERIDAAVILGIVILNAILGFIQEYRAEKALRELKKYVTIRCKVLRDGQKAEIDARYVVPGDIVYLNIGDIVPADLRLINAEEMTTDESALTGESLPVVKDASIVSEQYSVPQDLKNMTFMGTAVASGAGHGIVTATGKNTFFGKTARYLKDTPHEGDFQKNIRKFSNFLLRVIIVLTVFVFAANAILGRGMFSSFLFAVALAVGITPEILPIIVTITLSNGALRMARQKVITKRLVSVEDLGNIDTLCCDKTGTLTEGEITLAGYVNADGQKDNKVVLYGLLCNSAQAGKGRHSFGNPIDRAIWKSDAAASLKPELEKYTVTDINDFDFERRRMSVIARGTDGNTFIAKGAPESVFSVSTSVSTGGASVPFSPELRTRLKDVVEGYEHEGYRVIAIALKPFDKDESVKADEQGLSVVGFTLYLDPAKKTVKESLKLLKKLRVNIKIISGDSSLITRKICNDVGLAIAEDKVVTGEELQKLSDEEFKRYSMAYNVFARVTPEQKYQIVASLNHEGHIVGYLGDGINDVPALKAADVGITVDSATGIAKEAADIILLKKSLHVLAQGIIEGRKTFGNITKYILNTISANQGNMVTVALSSLFLTFIPILPSQILLNNFLSDLPMLTIATDNVDEELLRRPKRWNIRMISHFMMYFGLISSVFDILFILPLLLVFKTSIVMFRTAWFVESVLSEVIVTFAIRTKLPFYRSRPSRLLLLASLVIFVTAIAVSYTQFGATYFEFARMPAPILAYMMLVLAAYFITVETAKKYFFKKFEI